MYKKIYKYSFSYFVVNEREKLKTNFGNNWNKTITEKYLKNIILDILDIPYLKMSKYAKQYWKNKMKNEFGKMEILKIFYDTQLASEGLNVNKQNYVYK